MPWLGAHLSIAGGLPRAIDRAMATRCDALQLFTKSVGQWRARTLDQDEVRAFREAASTSGIRAVFAHASYLPNLAADHPELRARSVAAVREELVRATRLGLHGLVMHPGCGPEGTGLGLIADALVEVMSDPSTGETPIVLEHTAGQGNSLGHRFEHFAAVIDRLPPRFAARLGVCFDSCHLVAAGYAIHTREGYRRTFEEFDRIVGLERLRIWHLNDSKRPCGSRVDRHAAIGEGCLGFDTFARLLNDQRFAHLPMVIETPKEGSKGLVDPWDVDNLARLRGLLKPRRRPLAGREPLAAGR
jgi:deoxyribonuclease IV